MLVLWDDPAYLDRIFLTQLGVATAEIGLSSFEITLHPATSDLPAETLDHFYHDHVLPRVIAHQGDLALHAGSVTIDGCAIAVTADTGQGKSTLTASLHAAGHPILGDDALIVSRKGDAHHVRAVYPSLRLNPDSAAHFFPGVEGRPMADYSPKRHLPLGATAESAPLAALFVLGAAAETITARRMPPAAAAMAIVANSFALDPGDRDRARQRMTQAAALAAAVPVWELRYPRDYACLPAVHDTIRQLLSSLEPG